MFNKRLAGICFMSSMVFALPGCGGGSDASGAASTAGTASAMGSANALSAEEPALEAFSPSASEDVTSKTVVDPFILERFVTEQNRATMVDQFNPASGAWEKVSSTVIEIAVRELQIGLKRGHWIWSVFPQIDGLGHSTTAKKYAIKSLEEAQAYLQHAVLGPRLKECFNTLLSHSGKKTAKQILSPKDPNPVDEMKVKSSATLFLKAAQSDEDRQLFQAVLDGFYAGQADELTLQKLQELQQN